MSSLWEVYPILALQVTTNWSLPWQIHQDSSLKTESTRYFSLAGHENVCPCRRRENHRMEKRTEWPTMVLGGGHEKSQRLTLNSDNIFTLHAECRHKGPRNGPTRRRLIKQLTTALGPSPVCRDPGSGLRDSGSRNPFPAIHRHG